MMTMDVPEFISERQRSSETAVEPLKTTGEPFSVRQGMVGLAIAAAVFNALTPPVIRMLEATSRGELGLFLLFMPVFVGVLCGEVGAMACWLVWAPGTFLRRLAVHWGLALGMGLCLFGGVLLASADIRIDWQQLQATLDDVASVGGVLPAVSLAVQIPLWPFRTHLGWRVARDDAAAGSNQSLSILDIMVGTAIVAVSLGLIRFVSGSRLNGFQNYMMLQMMVSGLGLALVSFVMLIPAMMLVLRTRHFGAGVGIYFGAVLLSFGGLIGVPSIIYGPPAPAEGMFAVWWGSLVFAASVAAPLFVWRAYGYRLVWARDRQ